MTLPSEPMLVFGVLATALALFVWDKIRYDVIAVGALLSLVVAGVIEPTDAFLGFAHPAVIIVAAVLILSEGMIRSGVVDVVADLVGRVGDRELVQVATLTAIVTMLSAFMSNTGALALMMPVAVQIARTSDRSPSAYLMPLAFGSILGGLITLIGTPSNIVVAQFRGDVTGTPFAMFDFTLIGGAIALVGLAFVITVGRRLVPEREGRASIEEMFEIEDYTAEAVVPEGSDLVGSSLGDAVRPTGEVLVVGLVRDGDRRLAPSSRARVRAGDHLIVEAAPDALTAFVDEHGLELAGHEPFHEDDLASDEVDVLEAVVMPDGGLEGSTARSAGLRSRHGINLLAVAREGERVTERLGQIRFRAGDVVLLQGDGAALQEALDPLALIPLPDRGIKVGRPRRLALSVGMFAAALAVAAAGLVPVEIALAGAALGFVLTGVLSIDEAYRGIDGQVIVLLGAMIPVGFALETSGGAAMVADLLVALGGGLPLVGALAALMVLTMALSNLVNNAAAAVIMAPIAVGLARGVGASLDPMLMGVAVGASAAFLTPLAHQNNLLVLGPGGYRFGDYARLGIPLSILYMAVALVVIPMVFPF